VIELIDILPFKGLDDCKIHLASWNGEYNPLDVFVRDRGEWDSWNERRGKKDEFNRSYIFSLIEFYYEPNVWLFGGIYHIRARHADRYEVVLCKDYKDYIGRLKIFFKRPGRAKSLIPDNHFQNMTLLELLRQPYDGEAFCGYENIDHSFSVLEPIFRSSKPDWKAALENIKGVYLITDLKNGKRYVGSAYGGNGMWSRWNCYISTGHGWNDELTKLIEKEGIEYSRNHFKITLLEYRPMKVDDQSIIEREAYWKNVLLTRGEYGYNKN
jgi:hypothetical protein